MQGTATLHLMMASHTRKECKMYQIKITYYHTLYKRNVTEHVADDIVFKDGKAVFSSMGYRQAVEAEYIVSIEPIED